MSRDEPLIAARRDRASAAKTSINREARVSGSARLPIGREGPTRMMSGLGNTACAVWHIGRALPIDNGTAFRGVTKRVVAGVLIT
jgi:hypothetical protein